MKSFFRKFIVLIVSVTLIMNCSTDLYDYDELNNRLDIFDKRLTELEEWCKETNTNINSLKALVESLLQHDVITPVTPIMNESQVVGYTLTFLNSYPITIYNVLDGKDGINGADGADGEDGKDGYTPLIGAKQDTDGVYYWTLDGQWMTDDKVLKSAYRAKMVKTVKMVSLVRLSVQSVMGFAIGCRCTNHICW